MGSRPSLLPQSRRHQEIVPPPVSSSELRRNPQYSHRRRRHCGHSFEPLAVQTPLRSTPRHPPPHRADPPPPPPTPTHRYHLLSHTPLRHVTRIPPTTP